MQIKPSVIMVFMGINPSGFQAQGETPTMCGRSTPDGGHQVGNRETVDAVSVGIKRAQSEDAGVELLHVQKVDHREAIHHDAGCVQAFTQPESSDEIEQVHEGDSPHINPMIEEQSKRRR